MAKIIAKIAKDGTTTFKVEGVQGAGCTDLTKALENALGRTVSTEQTSEYYEEQAQEQQKLSTGG